MTVPYSWFKALKVDLVFSFITIVLPHTMIQESKNLPKTRIVSVFHFQKSCLAVSKMQVIHSNMNLFIYINVWRKQRSPKVGFEKGSIAGLVARSILAGSEHTM